MTAQLTYKGIGFFSKEDQAEQAVKALESSGFTMSQVSILAKQLKKDVVAGGATTGHRVKGQDINDSQRWPEDALTGALWGGLLGGLSSLAIPGAGAVIAVGSIGTAFLAVMAGQGAGAVATMNLKEGLQSLGIPQERVGAFSDRLLSSDFMVIADGTQEDLNQAAAIFQQQGIEDWDIYPTPEA
ncbi:MULTISPECIES: hypothetical protein [Cyanophyceae]|uniref:General stress protein 17M-like domain-containing protein n=1 Tax=Leptolyngbya subtilissima DQ-A4 TaxID=2933933 RepID=A0ABV0JZQ3_9CYAN|nr:hypothetical protein [Nodosilinea sp. FACHB-141]MBD2112612.1 hypothetical protein [Nodosilinea sp. FACHB-141]